ncbi:MAG: antibiotic biosynthesis monooxygenase [Synechococcales cyanobacterium C42_A2020_086]|jgi:quinol monooxygenase YgiN|nr:antibiotic biosynthesis monooxygenase [Synechococcales cyanobacterium C42_A2020_086]
MIQIDRANTVSVGLDLYTVAARHQDALIDALIQQVRAWATHDFFVAAAVHQSLDGVRMFTYSQWHPRFDYRSLPTLTLLNEFFPADRHLLEVVVSRPHDQEITIAAGEHITHLAEFRMLPSNQLEMMRRANIEIDRAMESPGLISATFHRSLDGTRIFNYGQWQSRDAFEAILQQPGFSLNQPYWEGLARNEFHLYTVMHTFEK